MGLIRSYLGQKVLPLGHLKPFYQRNERELTASIPRANNQMTNFVYMYF